MYTHRHFSQSVPFLCLHAAPLANRDMLSNVFIDNRSSYCTLQPLYWLCIVLKFNILINLYVTFLNYLPTRIGW